ncbi:hypothetical protein ACQEVF_09795 [Nonomuraea polychroma]|uniref:hypothetical protein n=1 Tax=Nonomuraea polychroma TaxID=46176 RepID=UPI003D939BE8
MCALEAGVVFELGIGADVIHECSHCDRPFAVPADEHETATVVCSHCGANVPVAGLKDLVVCVCCLRQGKAALTKDTEYGMVRCDFSTYAPEDPESAFLMAMRDSDTAGVWEHLPDCFPAHTELGSHVFGCRTCNGRRGHLDLG